MWGSLLTSLPASSFVNPHSSLFLTQQPQWSFKIMSDPICPHLRTLQCTCHSQRKVRLIAFPLNYLLLVVFHLISTAPSLFHSNLATDRCPCLRAFAPTISFAGNIFFLKCSQLFRSPFFFTLPNFSPLYSSHGYLCIYLYLCSHSYQ